MEKEFNELLEQVRAEFPDYRIQMGLADFQNIGKGRWFIEMTATNSAECECCHAQKPFKAFSVYDQATFADALKAIRDKVKEGGEI